ncbi:MAG: DNA internalization-related competence protein ComEC/Rec2 [Lachnospiraceae bacterium]|nr:DNA internalization-related competence protein ComEC/Rec2 [Lachnospiraceae bacterium]
MRTVRKRRIKRPLCLICPVFTLIVYITSPISLMSPSFDTDHLSGKTVSIEGTISDRQTKDDRSYLFLKDVTFLYADDVLSGDPLLPRKSTGIKVSISSDKVPLFPMRIGARVSARGIFEPFDSPTCEGQFDLRSYYLIRGYEGQLKRARITGVSKSFSYIPEKLRVLRDLSKDTLSRNMSEEDAGLVAAMTLGDRTGLDEEIKELYQNAGISHVLALSGLHIASVGLALYALLKKAGLSPGVCAALSGTVITVYAVMTGMSTSTVRALIMFLLSVFAILIGRTYDLLSAASLSAIVILAFDNRYIYDSGFLLSFLAVASIAVIHPLFAALPSEFFPEKKMNKVVKGIYDGISVSISVMLATLPVMARSFMKISLCSVVINLAVIPLMGSVLATSFAGMLIGDLGPCSGMILKITHYILMLYRLLAEKSEKFPGNVFLTGRPRMWQIITYATLLTIAITRGYFVIFEKLNNSNGIKCVNRTGQHNLPNNERSPIFSEPEIAYVIESWSDLASKRCRKRRAYAFMAVVIISAVMILTYQKREEVEIRNVDVGQGDCSIIWGKDIPAVMIDGGSTDVKRVAKYRILPVLLANRIKNVDFCFLTHMDSDHVNGVLEMLEDDTCPVRIRNVIISSSSLKYDKSDNLKRLLELGRMNKVHIAAISANDVITAGDMKIKCIAPQDGYVSGFDANASSLVLALTLKNGYGTEAGPLGGQALALFTGDIGQDTERSIAKGVPKVYYLKVAHHGSATSSTDIFLKRAHPLMSVISVGKGNSYGHPSPETLSRLENAGTFIYRTDKCGEIITLFTPEGIKTETLRQTDNETTGR